tara:strand:+ start:1126 stop:1488 length:363 start_codon:yes stop_codon:yes gene_type:complete
VDFSELTAAATTETVDLVTLPTGAQIDLCVVDLLTTFSDAGSITDVTVEVGTAADPDAFVTSTDVFGPAAGQYRADGANPSASGVLVKAKFTATGDDLGDGAATNLDDGLVDFVIRYSVI